MDYVKMVLGNRKVILNENRKRFRKLSHELGNIDLAVQETVYMKKNTEEIKVTENHYSDLSDILLRQRRIYKEQSRELRTELIRLMDEQEAINRIWRCFSVLEGKEREYLFKLYVQKELYKTVEQTSGVSHKTFEKIRKKGMIRIINLYNSNLTNLEIINGITEEKIENPNNPKKSSNMS